MAEPPEFVSFPITPSEPPAGVFRDAILVAQRHRFTLEIGEGARAAFRNCSELSVEIQKVIVRHGGSPIPFKMPGRVVYTDVTLEYGVTNNRSLFRWFMQAVGASGMLGGSHFPYKRSVRIVQRERGGSELHSWRLHGAFPTKFTAGEWDNESDDFTIGAVTLTYDFFTPSGGVIDTPTQTELSALAARL